MYLWLTFRGPLRDLTAEAHRGSGDARTSTLQIDADLTSPRQRPDRRSAGPAGSAAEGTRRKEPALSPPAGRPDNGIHRSCTRRTSSSATSSKRVAPVDAPAGRPARQRLASVR